MRIWIVAAVKQYDLDDGLVRTLGLWASQRGRVCAMQTVSAMNKSS